MIRGPGAGGGGSGGEADGGPELGQLRGRGGVRGVAAHTEHDADPGRGNTIIPTPLLEGTYERAVAGGAGMSWVFVDGVGLMLLPVGRSEVVVPELVTLAEDR